MQLILVRLLFLEENREDQIFILRILLIYMLIYLPIRRNWLVAAKIWNAGYENHRVREIAGIVRRIVDKEGVEIAATPTDDHRSYHISSDKIKRDLGFVPKHTIEDAVQDLVDAFSQGEIRNPMENLDYYNVKKMDTINLS